MLLPLTLLVSAVQITIGLLATSFKDAQSYLTLFAFVPAVAGFVLSGERLAAASGWPMGFELNALAGPLLGAAALPPFAVVGSSSWSRAHSCYGSRRRTSRVRESSCARLRTLRELGRRRSASSSASTDR